MKIFAKSIYNKKFSSSDIKIEILSNALWASTPTYDAAVTDAWREKERLAKEDGVKIWDGTYYRVANISEVENGELLLRLGTVPYRYIATASDLKDLFQGERLEPLFHLSTAAMIRTSNGYYLFGKRSRNGQIDLIGGGVQEDEIEIIDGSDLEKNLRKEIIEEAGLEETHIQSIEGVGIVRANSSNIIIISHIQLKVSDEEANEIFKDRQDDEMSELIFIPEKEIKSFLRGMTSYRPLIADYLI